MNAHRTTSPTDLIALRVLGEDDREQTDRLAALDSAGPLRGDLVIGAEAGGRLIAALSVADGKLIADPFSPTSEAIDLLRLRAEQLGGKTERPTRLRRMIDGLGRGHAHAGLAGSPPGAGGKLLQL